MTNKKTISKTVIVEPARTKDETSIYVPLSIRVFLSYSIEDRHLAAGIKSGLEEYGIQVFMAHDDIRPSTVWEDEILQKLDEADIFLPIITENFKKSNWTDQESGYALAKGKKIIPLSVRTTPYGFINKFQAAKCDPRFPHDTSWKIIEEIKNSPKYREAFVDSVINAFTRSVNFDQANKLSSYLEEFETLSKERVRFVIDAALENAEIKFGYIAWPDVVKLVERHSHELPRDILDKVEKVDKEIQLAHQKAKEKGKDKEKKEEINLDDIPF